MLYEPHARVNFRMDRDSWFSTVDMRPSIGIAASTLETVMHTIACPPDDHIKDG